MIKKEDTSLLGRIILFGKKLLSYFPKRTKVRANYGISDVSITDKKFILSVTVEDPLYKDIMPIVTVNGIPVSVRLRSSTVATIHIGKAVTAESKLLHIQIGNRSYTLDNPYYMVMQAELPSWQCVGHIKDRRILIPKSYFPNSNERVTYYFSLYIDDVCNANFIGLYIPSLQAIEILIGNDIRLSECIDKTCELRVQYGRKNSIPLPAPRILPKIAPVVV